MATLPGDREHAPVVGLIAHVDTSPDAPGAGVEPIVHRDYDGGVDRAAARRHRARPGVDARAGRQGRPRHRHLQRRHAARRRRQGRRRRDHGRRRAPGRAPRAAAPDAARSASRPTRRSARARRSSTSSASAPRCAYTIDGSTVGELQDETFTARRGRSSRSHGVDVHPGFATGKLVNAARLAGADPRRAARRPPHARDDLGPRGVHPRPTSWRATAGRAEIRAIVRDFDDDLLERARRAAARAPPRRSSAGEPRARLEVDVRRQYPNMRRHLEPFPESSRRPSGRSAPRASSRSARRSAAAPTARC